LHRSYLIIPVLVACATPPTRMSVEPEEVRLNKVGATAVVKPLPVDDFGHEADSTGIVWTSADDQIATVAPDGTVTAKSSGKTSVKGAIGDVNASAIVSVEIYGSGTLNLPTFLLPGQSANLQFDLKDDKGLPYSGMAPDCASENPAIATIKDGKITAVAAGSTKVTCTIADQKLEGTLGVLPPEWSDFAVNGGQAATDFTYVRSGVDQIPAVKKAGVDKVQLSKFELHRGKRTFFYEFCGIAPIQATMNDAAGNPLDLVFTGPCKGTFPADKMPWVGAPWSPLLAAAHDRGMDLGKDAVISVSASNPDTWTLKSGGKTLTMTGGVVAP